MKKIIAFGASNSKNSINQQLANYAASLVDGVEVQLVDLNEYEMPLFSVDKKESEGIPPLANQFKDVLRGSQGVIISLAEHNGSYTVAFKNIYDWISVIEKEIWLNKPMLLLATSPGARGGSSVLGNAMRELPHRAANIVGSFSLPSFSENFSDGAITEPALDEQLKAEVNKFQQALE